MAKIFQVVCLGLMGAMVWAIDGFAVEPVSFSQVPPIVAPKSTGAETTIVYLDWGWNHPAEAVSFRIEDSSKDPAGQFSVLRRTPLRRGGLTRVLEIGDQTYLSYWADLTTGVQHLSWPDRSSGVPVADSRLYAADGQCCKEAMAYAGSVRRVYVTSSGGSYYSTPNRLWSFALDEAGEPVSGSPRMEMDLSDTEVTAMQVFTDDANQGYLALFFGNSAKFLKIDPLDGTLVAVGDQDIGTDDDILGVSGVVDGRAILYSETNRFFSGKANHHSMKRVKWDSAHSRLATEAEWELSIPYGYVSSFLVSRDLKQVYYSELRFPSSDREILEAESRIVKLDGDFREVAAADWEKAVKYDGLSLSAENRLIAVKYYYTEASEESGTGDFSFALLSTEGTRLKSDAEIKNTAEEGRLPELIDMRLIRRF